MVRNCVRVWSHFEKSMVKKYGIVFSLLYHTVLFLRVNMGFKLRSTNSSI